MKDGIDARGGPAAGREVADVAFDELDRGPRNGARFSRLPVEEIVQDADRVAPRRTRTSTMCEPMKPAPPVTR